MSTTNARGVTLFAPHPALVRIADEMEPAGEPGQATLAFRLAADAAVTITIRAQDGAVVKTLHQAGVSGLNLAHWNLMTDAARSRPAAPGEYRVELKAGDLGAETTLTLRRFVRWTR